MATIRTPFTDSNIKRRVISAMVGFIDWTEAPLVKRLGLENDKRWKFLNWRPGGVSKLIELIEDTMSPLATQLNGAIDASQTQIVVDNGEYIHAGHVLIVESEYMVATSVSNNTVTVLRAQGGTSGAGHADNTAVTLSGIAKLSGAAYAIGHTTTTTQPFNYPQIMEESVEVTGDQDGVEDYGVTDTMAYHLAKLIGGSTEIGAKGRSGQMIKHLGNMAYKGKRQAPTASVPGMAGGLDVFIVTNLVGDTNTALSRANIESMLRDIWTAGGKPDLIVTNAWGATKIASMYENKVRTERSEERGGYVIKRVDTPVIEDVEILVDWQCPTTKTYILDSDKVGWLTSRPFQTKTMPSLGDYEAVSVIGEYSFMVGNELSHAVITHSATK